MKTTVFSSALAFALALPLTACGQSGQDGQSPNVASAASTAQQPASTSLIGAEIRKAMDKAKQDLQTKNIDVGDVHIGNGAHFSGSRPKAEITPQGDLLIAGQLVPATPAQHDLLLDYRQQVIGIAEAGMDIGSQGADLGMSAAQQAIGAAFSGKSDKDIEASIKPQTDKIEAAAAGLCRRMPDLLASQQKLATAMPAFQPYATMTRKDVDDCMKDAKEHHGGAVFSDD